MRVLEESTAKFSLQRISARLKGLVHRRYTAIISRNPQLRRTIQQQGATTEQQGATTEQQDATTEQQGATTEQQDATTEQQGATTEQQDATTEQQGATTEQQDATTEQQGATTGQQSATTDQQGVAQDINGEPGIEMTDLQQSRSSNQSERNLLAQGQVIDNNAGLMMSRFVALGNSKLAIGFDPRMVTQYSRQDVKIYLNLTFFILAVLAFSTGILLWIMPTLGLAWTILTVYGVFMSLLESIYFIRTVGKKARNLKKKPYKILPAGGTRAPPPSALDLDAPDFQMEPESMSETPEPAFGPRDRAGADRIINALGPRRRLTFEALDEDGGSSRRPAREDTEANIGL
jgi:hypothetical protein